MVMNREHIVDLFGEVYSNRIKLKYSAANSLTSTFRSIFSLSKATFLFRCQKDKPIL